MNINTFSSPIISSSIVSIYPFSSNSLIVLSTIICFSSALISSCCSPDSNSLSPSHTTTSDSLIIKQPYSIYSYIPYLSPQNQGLIYYSSTPMTHTPPLYSLSYPTTTLFSPYTSTPTSIYSLLSSSTHYASSRMNPSHSLYSTSYSTSHFSTTLSHYLSIQTSTNNIHSIYLSYLSSITYISPITS